jgi:hypothetical protein
VSVWSTFKGEVVDITLGDDVATISTLTFYCTKWCRDRAFLWAEEAIASVNNHGVKKVRSTSDAEKLYVKQCILVEKKV